MSNTRRLLRDVWRAMVARCHNPSRKDFPRYGGKGITVCVRWRESFDAFLADMGERPSPDHSIDRIDNDKGYEPGNCRWATRKELARNSTLAKRFTFNGETLTIAEWCERFGLTHQRVNQRVRVQGWSWERALTTPPLPSFGVVS